MAKRMGYVRVNFEEKLALFSKRWAPKVIAEFNDYQFKLAKLEGEFGWHEHRETDEAFVVLAGALRIELRDGAVELKAGELFVVPKGVEHRPVADGECHVLLVEPRGVVSTGEVASALRAENNVWI